MTQRMGRLLVLAMVLGSVMAWVATPASAELVRHSNYDHFSKLRFKEKWLLPAVTLSNPYAARDLGFEWALRGFTTMTYMDFSTGNRVSGNPSKAIMAADLNFQPAPFGTDVLLKRDQANALIELGMLSHIGHFAVVNGGHEWVRPLAVNILNQLGEIADHFKLGNLKSQYERLAGEVADPRFSGGPSATVTRYDDTVRALYDYVANSYGVDGHWYFMYGGDMGGLLALTLGGDRLHTQYFLSVAHDLYNCRPTLRPDYVTRTTLAHIQDAHYSDSGFLAGQTWNVANHFVFGGVRWNPFPREQLHVRASPRAERHLRPRDRVQLPGLRRQPSFAH